MQVEFGELELRHAGLRVVDAGRQARLEASLAREGQQSPVLVVVEGERFVLVDGYQRVAALKRLGHDVVDALVLAVEEATALVEVWRLETSRRRTALEDGWLLAELVERHGRTQAELASLFRRSKSWVSRRLGIVRVLPESVQEAVRAGIVPAHGAMKFLVPLARANAEHCERLVRGLGKTSVSVRQLERLYTTWRAGDDALRERIVTHPLLFLKADEAVSSAEEEDEDEGQKLAVDLETLSGLCGRVRRRVREGVFTRANPASQCTVKRSWREVQLTFEGLEKCLNQEIRDVESGDTQRHPSSS